MAKFTNTGKGPRGIVLKKGNATLYLDPNETIELNKADVSKVHPDIEEGTKAAKEAKSEDAE